MVMKLKCLIDQSINFNGMSQHVKGILCQEVKE